MASPRSVVPESVMPGYPFLAKRTLDYADIGQHMAALRIAGVPYTDEMIEKAKADAAAQISPDSKEAKELLARYPKAQVRKFDGAQGSEPTELDALIAYLQMLGTLVDFADFDAAGPNLR
jgi:cytochrome c oxidase cbb3-type subunit 2